MPLLFLLFLQVSHAHLFPSQIESGPGACANFNSKVCFCTFNYVSCNLRNSWVEIKNDLQQLKDKQISLRIDFLSLFDETSKRVHLPANAFESMNISTLTFFFSKMASIDPNAFNGTVQDSIHEIELIHSGLEEIPFESLKRLKNLRKLEISGRIKRFHPNTFTDFASKNSLNVLRLIDVNLTDAMLNDTKIFRQFSNLTELKIEGSSRLTKIEGNYGLTKIPPALRALSSLEKLDLRNNNILKIDERDLPFPALKYLRLSLNKISYIHPNAFTATRNLEVLELYDNRLVQFPRIDAPKLRELDLGRSFIKQLPKDGLKGHPKLKKFHLSESGLKSIEPGTLYYSPNLEDLHFGNNAIQKIPYGLFTNLTKLQRLSVFENEIEEIESKAFANLPNLRFIDISYNFLTTVPSDILENSMTSSTEFKELQISRNPWNCTTSLENMFPVLNQMKSYIIRNQYDDCHPFTVSLLEKPVVCIENVCT